MDYATEQVAAQLKAMGVERYDVGIRNDRGLQYRIWDEQRVLESLPWLKWQNVQGNHIYVRPDGPSNLSLVDDLSEINVRRMYEQGYQPAALIETSPDNFQVWLKHDRALNPEEGTAAAKALADRFEGDQKAADWRHYGRLAGFTNRKEDHRDEHDGYPWVTLHKADGKVYGKAPEFTADIAFKIDKKREEDRLVQEHYKHLFVGQSNGKGRSIDEFAKDPKYEQDGHRYEFAYAMSALRRGHSKDEVVSTIKAHRDHSHKAQNWVEATVDLAAKKMHRSLSAGLSR